MDKIVDYKVVWGNSINEINKNVNSCISDDWIPLGGISVKDQINLNDPNRIPGLLFCQAMILYAQK
jgi:hypothetical protein